MPNPTSTSTKISSAAAVDPCADAHAETNGACHAADLRAAEVHAEDPFAALPTETEIYILPGGEIVIADLPRELAERLAPHDVEPPAEGGCPDTTPVAHASGPND